MPKETFENLKVCCGPCVLWGKNKANVIVERVDTLSSSIPKNNLSLFYVVLQIYLGILQGIKEQKCA